MSTESQDAMHTLGSHRVYNHGIHQIKSFVSKGVACELCLQAHRDASIKKKNIARLLK